jgi:hypothetical protein
VTHYHVNGRAPFLNLSDVAENELNEVVRDLERERAQGASARVFGRRYMELRRRTEDKLRTLFIEVGGRPERDAPHYFVLGSSAWYRGLSYGMREVVLPLDRLPSDVSSFTYPDSFTSMALGPHYGLPQEPRPYHERVYRLEELPEVIDVYGLPADEVGEYDEYQHRVFEKYIEVQVWSDEPLRAFLP